MFNDLFQQVHYAYIFCAATLFIAGIYVAPNIVEKNIKWLLVYPRWVSRLIEKYFSTNWGFLTIFFIVFILNNFSLFTGFISGFLVICPFIFAFLTGFHVAVIGYDLMGWKGIWYLLINPVAWFEFVAAWINFGMGIKLAISVITGSSTDQESILHLLLPLYLKYVMVLLLVAAILESSFILWAQKHKNNHDKT